MANVIWFGSELSRYDVCMSNGLTAVFIDVLSLSGSQIARTPDEKRLIVWLSQKDQSKVGIGTVGFDICEMPWNSETFESDKAFILNVIEQAKNKAGWGCLQYKPREDFIFPCLDSFRKLILLMTVDDINPAALEEWLAGAEGNDPVLCGFPVCGKHHTLLTLFGCHVCNN